MTPATGLAALGALLACSSAWPASFTIGNPPPEFTEADNGNGNLLVCQLAQLTQPATLKSLSFYVTGVGGDLYLGVYSPAGALLASTAAFAPALGWNTKPTLASPLLQPATYCLAYHPSSNALAFVKRPVGQGARYYSRAFGPLPVSFSATYNTTASQWSFYATLETTPPTPVNGMPGAPAVSFAKYGSMTFAWEFTLPIADPPLIPPHEFHLFLNTACPGGPYRAVESSPATVDRLPWGVTQAVQISAFNGLEGECSNVATGQPK